MDEKVCREDSELKEEEMLRESHLFQVIEPRARPHLTPHKVSRYGDLPLSFDVNLSADMCAGASLASK